MTPAPLLVVKPLSLPLIIVVAAGCATDQQQPSYAYVSPYAPSPLNVEPPDYIERQREALVRAQATRPEFSRRAEAPRPPRAQPRPGVQHMEPGASTEWIDPGVRDPVAAREATAILVPTQGNHVSGVVRFREREGGDGLDVIASVDGLTGGAHAYHVHVYGDCSSPDARSAGPHFHFSGSSFDEEVPIITGDLGELRPDHRLTTVHRTRVRASLHGRYSIIGRAVVVHEHGNDPASPPDGAAGKRLACGVIGVSGPVPAAPATAHHP